MDFDYRADSKITIDSTINNCTKSDDCILTSRHVTDPVQLMQLELSASPRELLNCSCRTPTHKKSKTPNNRKRYFNTTKVIHYSNRFYENIKTTSLSFFNQYLSYRPGHL